MRRERGEEGSWGERERERQTDRQTETQRHREARGEDEKHVRCCPVNWALLGCVEDSRHGPPFAPYFWKTADTVLPSPHTFGGQQTLSSLRPTLLEDSRHGPPFAPHFWSTADTVLPSPHTFGGQQTLSSLRPTLLEDSRHGPPFAPHFWMARAVIRNDGTAVYGAYQTPHKTMHVQSAARTQMISHNKSHTKSNLQMTPK